MNFLARMPAAWLVWVGVSAPTAASALVWPAPFPTAPQTCVYEGVFPGSGAIGRWRVTAGEPGQYTVAPENIAHFGGIVARYVTGLDPAAETLPFTVAEGVLTGQERVVGNTSSARETLDAVLAFEGEAHAHITEVMDRKTSCADLAPEMKPGDRWTCSERVDWRWNGSGPRVQPLGTSKSTSKVTYEYREDQPIAGPDGAMVTAAVLVIDSDGRSERVYLDPNAPWCPLKTERIKLGHVVGTDTLIAIERPQEVHLPNRDHGNITLPRFALMLLVGALGVAATAFGIGWFARRRLGR